MSVATVKIKVKPCKGNEAGVVVMNEADYLANKDKYELYDPAKEAALKAQAEEAAKKAEAEKADQERLEKEKAEKEAAEQKAKGKK